RVDKDKGLLPHMQERAKRRDPQRAELTNTPIPARVPATMTHIMHRTTAATPVLRSSEKSRLFP
ncbi:MAG: hypothetical protein ACTSRF_15535, partial [Candidatus Freyarchaeota archaeon]